MSYSASRNDVKQLTQQIENLAKQVTVKLDAGEPFLPLANELVRNTSTLTFVLGEVYAVEQLGNSKKMSAKTVQYSSKSNTSNYRHNKRDSSTGRFLPRV